MRHALSARAVVDEAAARLRLDASDVDAIFEGVPLDFPIVFSSTLPLLTHRLGMAGITLFGRVWLLESMRRIDPASLIALVRHEAEHVRQQRERPVAFYPLYGLGFLGGLFGSARRDMGRLGMAYRAIGYEREAYGATERARATIAAAIEGRGRRG